MFKLVIDANIILSALIKDSITRRILIGSAIEFYAPDYLIEEIEKHIERYYFSLCPLWFFNFGCSAFLSARLGFTVLLPEL